MENDLNSKITNDLINKAYYNDVRRTLRGRCICKCIGDTTEAFAQIFTGISVVLSFAAGFFDLYLLSFLSGCFGIISIIFLRCSSYSMKESKERTNEINIILNKLGINEIPNIAVSNPN